MLELPSALIGTAWLHQHVEHPALRILDCSVLGKLTDEYHPRSGRYKFSSGRSLWAESHIPGSVHVDLLHDLSDEAAAYVFMMPEVAEFVRVMEHAGVADDTSVVLYDRGPIQESARVWWMLRSIGFERSAVLDGGWRKWIEEGRPASSDDSAYPASRLTVRAGPRCFVSLEDVINASSTNSQQLVNALSDREFRGIEARYGRAGRIPGSVSLPYGQLLKPGSGTVASRSSVQQHLDEADLRDDRPIITYCGGGLAAAFVAFVLTMQGRNDVMVYDGSMLEWAANDELPLELG